jgi:hypothetical protein
VAQYRNERMAFVNTEMNPLCFIKGTKYFVQLRYCNLLGEEHASWSYFTVVIVVGDVVTMGEVSIVTAVLNIT